MSLQDQLREQFTDWFYQEHGYYPDEDTIEAYIGESTRPRQTSFSFHTPTAYEDDGASELLSEFKDTFRGIKKSAKRTYENQKDYLDNKPYLNEFFFLLLIFLSKASLYFLLKKTYEIGLDVADF